MHAYNQKQMMGKALRKGIANTPDFAGLKRRDFNEHNKNKYG